MLGDADEAVLRDRDFLGEHAVDLAAEGGAGLGLVKLAADPGGHEVGRDPIARLEPGRPRAGRDHLAGPVRQGNPGQRHLRVVDAPGDHQVAIIERDRADPDEDLPEAGRGRGKLLAPQGFRSGEFVDSISLHASGLLEASMTIGRQLARGFNPLIGWLEIFPRDRSFPGSGMLQRAIAWAAGMAMRLIALAPIVAIVSAAMLDSGPGSRVRFSLFPLVLTAYDPFVWTCLRNGIVLAAAVSIGAIFIGVRLGWVLARTSFWTRPLLASLTIASAVVPPAFVALGLLHFADGSGPPIWQRLVDESLPWAGYPGQTWPWLIWGWSALVQGVGLVVIATTAALSRIDSRGKTPRGSSGRARGVWRTLTWPAIRPSVAEAAGLVFVITLADPAAPLILGLRRTPGFQVALLALGLEPFPRLAAMGLMVLVAALGVGTLVRSWGGPRTRDDGIFREGDAHAHRDRSSPASWGRIAAWRVGLPSGSAGASPSRRTTRGWAWLRGPASVAVVAAWVAVAWLPLVGLMRMGLSGVSGTADSGTTFGARLAGFLGRLAADPAGSHIRHSVLLGVGFALAAWLLARTFLASRGGPRSRGRTGWLAEAAASVPPVVWGIGTACGLGVSQLVSQSAWVGSGPSAVSRTLDAVSLAMDPARLPGFALLAGVCLAMLSRRFVRWTASGEP